MKRIATAGILPTNVAFTVAGPNRIYVTEYQGGQIEVFDASTSGLTLYDGDRPVIKAVI